MAGRKAISVSGKMCTTEGLSRRAQYRPWEPPRIDWREPVGWANGLAAPALCCAPATGISVVRLPVAISIDWKPLKASGTLSPVVRIALPSGLARLNALPIWPPVPSIADGFAQDSIVRLPVAMSMECM